MQVNNQSKEVAKLLTVTLSNIIVIGFGLAIYEDRPLALVAGVLAITLAVGLIWRAER